MMQRDDSPDSGSPTPLGAVRLERALAMSGMATFLAPAIGGPLVQSTGFGDVMGDGPDGSWTLESWLAWIRESDRRAVRCLFEDASTDGVGEATFRASVAGEARTFRVRVTPGSDGALAVVQDVSAEFAERERARMAGNVDVLTGLPNRRQFQSALGEAVARALRADTALAVLHVEFDGFTEVVDAFGVGPADDVLRAVAARLRSGLRSSDALGRGGRPLARVGAAGFLVALPDLGGRFEPIVAAERLLAQLRRPYPLGDAEITITASMGLAALPDAGSDPIDLLRHAEVALAHARRLGGDRLEVFRDGLDRDAESRLAQASELYRGIRSHQLELVYQPVFKPDDGSCQGVEALVRWRHPERGLLAPEEFLPVAEDTGIIVALGEWVLSEACAQWRRWLDRGVGPVEISVNLSGRQLRDPKLVARVHRVLAASQMDPVFLRLEVPEDVLTPAGEAARRALGRLRRLGVGLTLDDFGTRSSALSQLREVDVDIIKIGRAFVESIPDDQEHSSLVSGLVSLAHKLRFRVVAEGVENEAQLRYLTALDCEGVQGFLLGRPAPPAELEQVLARTAGPAAARKVIPFRRRAAS